MSVDKYMIFNKVVKSGSFTKAAELMGYTQSGISHAINSLEEEFGFKLLQRSRSGVKVTSEGEYVLRSIKEIVAWEEQLKQTVAAINGVVTGKIRIGTFESVSIHWMPQILKAFLTDYPNIEFEMIDGDYTQIEAWILERKIDCGFINFSIENPALKITPLKEDRLLLVLPKGHPLEESSSISIREINGESFVLPGEGMNYDVGKLIGDYSLDLNVRYRTKNDHATLAMVANGLGISILPQMFLEEHSSNVVIKEFEECTCRQLAFATLHEGQRAPAVNIFEKYVVDQFI